uniref:Translation initiation factor IF-2-like n=1 Tax=Bursaphelenchus xylophilus TaxID=6326 RepID=A0A1I7SP77_BURXY
MLAGQAHPLPAEQKGPAGRGGRAAVQRGHGPAQHGHREPDRHPGGAGVRGEGRWTRHRPADQRRPGVAAGPRVQPLRPAEPGHRGGGAGAPRAPGPRTPGAPASPRQFEVSERVLQG